MFDSSFDTPVVPQALPIVSLCRVYAHFAVRVRHFCILIILIIQYGVLDRAVTISGLVYIAGITVLQIVFLYTNPTLLHCVHVYVYVPHGHTYTGV